MHDCRVPRHHTVPQFYLRGFADEADQVMLVDRDDLDRSHRLAVRKALSEVGFYRLDPVVFEVEDESQRPHPEYVEQYLSKFERAAVPGICKLRETGLADVTQEDWYHLVNLIALQTVRGNRFREDLEATGTHALRFHVDEIVTDDLIGRWLNDMEEQTTAADISAFRERLLGPHGPRLVPSREFAIRESLQLALGRLGERLADGMTWSLIEAADSSVLTSDEPVAWWSPGGGPIGFGSAQVVWFPVSRRRILQLRDRSLSPASLGLPDPASPEGRDDLVRFVNREVATQAHRWVVHHPDDQPLDGLVLGPRTAWANELIAVEEAGTTRRELHIHRRLPVPPNPQP